MTNQSNICTCLNCPGSSCTCGCQSTAPVQASSCQCGDTCACGENCQCDGCQHAGARASGNR